MIGKHVALEALCALCQSSITFVKKQGFCRSVGAQKLFVSDLIPTILNANTTRRNHLVHIHVQSALQGDATAANVHRVKHVDIDRLLDKKHVIDEEEFFDPRFDYDFTNLRYTETYYRGGEVYDRPYGWQRFALKVLDKYEDNKWLGTRYGPASERGEWPVSYHGTSKRGAEGIIEGFYKPGAGCNYGRGVYSAPDMATVNQYARTFTSKITGLKYKVILQNRINFEYGEKRKDGKYYLIPIPEGTPAAEERQMVQRAIRPYGFLLQEEGNPKI